MNSQAQNNSDSDSGAGFAVRDAEASLRLIAALPAPDGLVERVQAGMKSAPRRARILEWPRALRRDSGWMRTAAAAAIVFVVAGGGWGVYTRVQPQANKVVVMPARTGGSAGFSSAGAMRTPQTLQGPVLAHPVVAKTVEIKPAGTTAKKSSRRSPSAASAKTAAPIPVPAAK
jgi:hypothetical protein